MSKKAVAFIAVAAFVTACLIWFVAVKPASSPTTQFKLTVYVLSNLVSSVRIYRNSGLLFPTYDVVQEQFLPNGLETPAGTGTWFTEAKIIFELDPGHYFVYPVAREGAAPFERSEVFLSKDTEVHVENMQPL